MLEEEGVYLVAYPDRRPTGDAFVLFNNDSTATKALGRHKDYLGDRYVELFKASPSEMVQVIFLFQFFLFFVFFLDIFIQSSLLNHQLLNNS
ncbi:unnamed protein product [Trichobilharzia regenti]|nr:unnamed protein product [Trichobilharzia regenti]